MPDGALCRSCGAEVKFLATARGSTAIVNLDPVRVWLQVDGQHAVFHVRSGFIDHHATCPQSQDWKKRAKTKKAETKP